MCDNHVSHFDRRRAGILLTSITLRARVSLPWHFPFDDPAMAAPASPSLADATLPELVEEPQELPRAKDGVQLAGFAAGIASVRDTRGFHTLMMAYTALLLRDGQR